MTMYTYITPESDAALLVKDCSLARTTKVFPTPHASLNLNKVVQGCGIPIAAQGINPAHAQIMAMIHMSARLTRMSRAGKRVLPTRVAARWSRTRKSKIEMAQMQQMRQNAKRCN